MDDQNKEHELLLAELLIKVGALERILITKNLCTEAELTEQVKLIQDQVIKFLQEKFGTQISPQN
jgi:hypothetical protein